MKHRLHIIAIITGTTCGHCAEASAKSTVPLSPHRMTCGDSTRTRQMVGPGQSCGDRRERLDSACVSQVSQHEGQSLVEMTVGAAFLILVVLILFEMAMVFRAYIALLNAAREGAFFASGHPTMAHDPSVTCSNAVLDGTDYQTYVWITCQEAIAAGLNTDPTAFTVLPPVASEGTSAQQPIVVTVRYQLVNPTQGIVMPWLGRMGLLSSFPISASTEAPIRLGTN